jgi:hypothetical protein
MSERTKLLCAEIARDAQVILVPSVAWEKALMPRIGEYEALWETRAETWAVSAEVALLIASVIEKLPSSTFAKSLSGAITAQKMDPDEGMDLQRDVAGFLRAGAFHWRFVET